MKKELSNLLLLSFILTTIGFLMDGDVKEQRLSLRFTDFFSMMGSSFTVISLFYFSLNFSLRRLKKIRS